jgi:hypothetical protein
MKKTSGSLPASIAQVIGRLAVTWYFLQTTTDICCFTHMATCWAIADLTKYLHYLFKNTLTTLFRYNLFIILYPLGVWGEMRVINDYIKRNAETITINEINLIRFIQLLIIVGTVFLYIYLLQSRRKHLKQKSR